MTDAVEASLLGALVGGGIGLVSALAVTRYVQRLRDFRAERARKKHLKSILFIIYSELKVQRAAWERKAIYPEQNRLIGFNLLMAREIVDMLSDDLVTDLMSVYLNLERLSQILVGFSRYDNEELMNLHLDGFVSQQQSLAIGFIDRCVPKVEKSLAILDSELEEQGAEFKGGWWDRLRVWVGL